MSNLHSQTLKEFIKQELFVKILSEKEGYAEPNSASNYTPKKVTERDWKIMSTDSKSQAVLDWIDWEFSEGKFDIYGFFVTDKDGKVIWAERSRIPYKVLRKGDKFRVKPKIVFEE